MKSLEKFIRENRNEFNYFSIPDGHEERFRLKLQAKQRSTNVRSLIRAAATIAVVIALTGAISLYYNSHFAPALLRHISSENAKQLYEVEAYYRSQLLRKYRAIEKIAQADDAKLPSPEQIVGESLTDKSSISSEIVSGPKSDVFVGAIIQSYQIRLETMDRVEKQLKEVEK